MNTPTTSLQWHSRIIQLSVPIIFANLSVPLVGLTDAAVAGRLAGPEPLAAVILGGSLFGLIFWAVGFLKMATIGLLAQAEGKQDKQEQHLLFWRTTLLALALAGLLLLLQVPIYHLGVTWLEMDPAIERQVAHYFDWRIYAAPAVLINYVILGCLIGLGRSRALLAWQLVLNLCNVVFSVALGLVFDFGVAGIAAASLIAECVATVFGLWLLKSSFTLFPLPSRQHLLATDWGRLMRINRDIFIRNWALSFTFFYFNAQSASLGALSLAANGAMIQLLHLSSYALDGYAHASEHLCGKYYGARKAGAFYQSVRYSGIWMTVTSLLIALLLGGFALYGLSWIIPQAAILDYATPYLPWLVLIPLVSASAYLLDGVYTGTSQIYAMRDAVLLSLLLFVVTSHLFLPLWGNHGLWAALCLAMLLRSATLCWYFPKLRAHFTPQANT